MKKKLKLDSLKVQSFITNVDGETIKGAGTQFDCTTWYSATQCIATKDCTLDPGQCIVQDISSFCNTGQQCLPERGTV